MEGMETAVQLLSSCYSDFLPIVLSAIKHIQFIQASVNFNEDLKFVNELITVRISRTFLPLVRFEMLREHSLYSPGAFQQHF